MFNKVLVPLGGSELEAQALSAVRRPVEGTHAEVTLLMGVKAPRATLQVRQALRRPLTEAVRAAARLGEPAHEITGYARRGGFDVIVMATRDRSGLNQALHGSSAAVVRSGIAPVLVVRPGGGNATRGGEASGR